MKEFPLPGTATTDLGSARDALRGATRAAHESVDAAFGRFDLTDPAGYRAFLIAHARVVPAVEAWLDAYQRDDLRPWSLVRRTPGLLSDLAELDVQVPDTVAFDPPHDEAAICGVTYVMEGSRLGGTFLSRQVRADLPRSYLGAPAQTVLWRAFLAGLDRHLPSPEAQERAIRTARDTFALFHAVAGE